MSTTTDMDEKYPELAKMQKAAKISQPIGEFIDWLTGEKDIKLAQEDGEGGRLYPIWPDMEKLLAEFFEIDLVKVERERRALLDEIRNG